MVTRSEIYGNTVMDLVKLLKKIKDNTNSILHKQKINFELFKEYLHKLNNYNPSQLEPVPVEFKLQKSVESLPKFLERIKSLSKEIIKNPLNLDKLESLESSVDLFIKISMPIVNGVIGKTPLAKPVNNITQEAKFPANMNNNLANFEKLSEEVDANIEKSTKGNELDVNKIAKFVGVSSAVLGGLNKGGLPKETDALTALLKRDIREIVQKIRVINSNRHNPSVIKKEYDSPLISSIFSGRPGLGNLLKTSRTLAKGIRKKLG